MKQTLIASLALGSILILSGCGAQPTTFDNSPPDSIGTPSSDGSVVHGRAVFSINSGSETTLEAEMAQLLPNLTQPTSPVNSTTTITYTNSPSTTFTVNTSAFTPGAMTGSTLSLGSFTVSALGDNNLQTCGAGGNTQCSQAIIRVYTLGNVSGFVNSAGGYGAPVYTGTLNPTTAIGLQEAGAVAVQTSSIPSTEHMISLSAFPSPTYNVTSNFSNAGAGTYSMTYVIEYALQ